jgi:hypothetical protein
MSKVLTFSFLMTFVSLVLGLSFVNLKIQAQTATSQSQISSTSLVSSMNSSMLSDTEDSSSSALATSLNTSKKNGTLLKIDGSKITVKQDDQTQEFNLADNIKITRDGKQAKLSDLQPNDKLSLTQTGFGEVLEIEATSESTIDMTKYVTIGIILLLIILGLIWYLQNRQTGKIKTTLN